MAFNIPESKIFDDSCFRCWKLNFHLYQNIQASAELWKFPMGRAVEYAGLFNAQKILLDEMTDAIKKRAYLFDEFNVGEGEFAYPCFPLTRSSAALSGLSAISEHVTKRSASWSRWLVDYASFLVVATKRVYKLVRSSISSITRFTP